MSRRLKQNDSLVSDVIKEISRELNMSESQVRHAIQHFFKWQREAFNELKYTKYLWNYFGTFTILPKRHDAWKEREEIKKQKEAEKQQLLTDKIINNE